MAEQQQQQIPQNQAPHNFLADFLFAGFSAALTKTLTAPFDRAKLLIQLQDFHPVFLANGIRFDGIMDCLSQIIEKEGFTGLFRGVSGGIFRYYPTQALNFMLKDSFANFFGIRNPDFTPTQKFMRNMLSGTAAGAVSLLLVYPIDLVSTRLAVDFGEHQIYSGFWDCFFKIVKDEGFLALYSGFGASIFGILVYRAAYFGLFDFFREYLKNDTPMIIKFLMANVFTVVSGLIAYPIDTMRRISMVNTIRIETLKAGSIPENFDWSVENRNASLLSYWNGAGSNILRGFGASMVLVFYDEFSKALRRR